MMQRATYSRSIARMETDGIYISTNAETATEGICHSKQHSHSSDATDRTHRYARNPHKSGNELLLQSTMRASPLQLILMRCQRWSRIQLLQALHSFACLALLQRTPPTVPRSLQCYGHSHEIAFRLHCYRACYIASLLTRDRLTP